MTAAVQTGGQRATSPRALTTVTDGERPGRASVQASANAVADLWASAWSRLTVEHPDLDDRWTSVEHGPAVARAMAAAGRESGRCLRLTTGDLAELDRRLRAWEASVLKALAAQDHARSERLCGDCGAENVDTVQPGLTGGRVCGRCLREVQS